MRPHLLTLNWSASHFKVFRITSKVILLSFQVKPECCPPDNLHSVWYPTSWWLSWWLIVVEDVHRLQPDFKPILSLCLFLCCICSAPPSLRMKMSMKMSHYWTSTTTEFQRNDPTHRTSLHDEQHQRHNKESLPVWVSSLPRPFMKLEAGPVLKLPLWSRAGMSWRNNQHTAIGLVWPACTHHLCTMCMFKSNNATVQHPASVHSDGRNQFLNRSVSAPPVFLERNVNN